MLITSGDSKNFIVVFWNLEIVSCSLKDCFCLIMTGFFLYIYLYALISGVSLYKSANESLLESLLTVRWWWCWYCCWGDGAFSSIDNRTKVVEMTKGMK